MKIFLNVFLIFIIFTSQACSSSESGKAVEVVPGIPVKNTVTLVDLGAKTCIPCKMMEPILEQLKEEYKGRAEVIFIDVKERANRQKAKAFKVVTIPTQIFFNKQGLEVYRHVGFLDKDSIVSQLETLLNK